MAAMAAVVHLVVHFLGTVVADLVVHLVVHLVVPCGGSAVSHSVVTCRLCWQILSCLLWSFLRVRLVGVSIALWHYGMWPGRCHVNFAA